MSITSFSAYADTLRSFAKERCTSRKQDESRYPKVLLTFSKFTLLHGVAREKTLVAEK